MLIMKKGNIFQTSCTIIAHGVNCQGAFGRGIAAQVAEKYPEAKKAYMEKFRSKESWYLGEMQLVETKDHTIANLSTQYYYGTDGVYVDYKGVDICFRKLFEYAASNNLSIAMPKIGCGLAGGDWNIIKELIRKNQLIHPSLVIEVWEL